MPAKKYNTPEEARLAKRAQQSAYQKSPKGKAMRAEHQETTTARVREYKAAHPKQVRASDQKRQSTPARLSWKRAWARQQREKTKQEETDFLGGNVRSRPKAQPARMPWLLRSTPPTPAAPQSPEERAAANRQMIEQMRARETGRHRSGEGTAVHPWWRRLGRAGEG